MNKTLILVAPLLLVLGCSADHGRFGPYYTPRVSAAKAIEDPGLRDDALHRVGLTGDRWG
jgi:hypothetical protein